MKNVKIRSAVALVVLLGAGVTFVVLESNSGEHAITRRVINVPFEKALEDYVARLERVEGVIEASYEDYDRMEKSALVTVVYDPNRTSARIITVWLGHTESIWDDYVMV